MMKALVIGATGFIGSHVARALVAEGIDVRITRRSTSPTLALEGLKYEAVAGDLDNPASLLKAMKGCEALFHAAGYYPLYSFDRKKQIGLALMQIRNVLTAAAESGIRKIVYTSSMSRIGKNYDGLSNEETPYDPRHFKGLYYRIKEGMEQEVMKAAADGLPVTIVNPTGVFGDYDVKPTSGTLVVAIAQGRLPFIIDAKMNAVDARDVAKGQIAAMKIGKVGRRYILGSHNTTVHELARLIARLAKVRAPMIKIPLPMAEVAARASEYVGRLLHQEKPLFPLVGVDFLRCGDHYDTTRAQMELGFKSTPLEETLERAIHWFREHHYL